MSLLALFRPFGSAPVTATTHSGVYRLLLAKLQQEVLDQYEAKRKKSPEEIEAVKEPVKEVVVKPVVKRVRKVVEEPARRFAPIRHIPSARDPFDGLAGHLKTITKELDSWYAAAEITAIRGIAVEQAKKAEAENDEEEEVFLLLLAA